MQKTTFFNLNETISPAGVVKSNPLLDFLHENNLSSCIQFKNNEKFFESQIPIEKISYEGKYLFSLCHCLFSFSFSVDSHIKECVKLFPQHKILL